MFFVVFFFSFVYVLFMFASEFYNKQLMWNYSQICLKAVTQGTKKQWPYTTDCFTRECTAEGQKQTSCITQMTVKGR
jgi:hypothetical protein